MNFPTIKNTNLNNVILAKKDVEEGYDIVLLAISKESVEFTTHLHNKSDDSISNGHYFCNIKSAVQDYEDRTGF